MSLCAAHSLPPCLQLVAKVTANWPATFVHLRAALVEAQVRVCHSLMGGRRSDFRRTLICPCMPGAPSPARCCCMQTRRLPHRPPRPGTQAELLEHLNWHLRLDLHRDVRPCHTLLFSPPAAACAGLEGPGAPLSATLQHMCEGIRHWALLVQGEERKRQAAGPDTPAVSSGGQHVGGKRQRRDA